MIKSVLKVALLLFILFSVSTPSTGQITIEALPADDGKEQPAIIYTLKNGLTVMLYENPLQAEVLGMVVTDAGGKDDPADATGMAHYMEHMLFKGTTELGTINWEEEAPHLEKITALYDSLAVATTDKKRASLQAAINRASLDANKYAIPNELDKVLKEMGGTRINAGTGPDLTVFYNSFPPHQIEKWLTLYSHRFEQPVFRGFQAELEVVYEEKNMYADMFFQHLLEEFNKQFFKSHPYGQQPLIGTIEHLKNPQLSKLKSFYDTYYVANNMALVLVGDFEAKKVMPLIEKYFGTWRTGELPEKKKWHEEPFKGREFYEQRLSPIPLGILGYRIPGSWTEEQPVLEVIESLLSNSSETGLLDQLMLENQLLLVQTVNILYEDYGTNAIIFAPKIMGQNIADAEKLILQELEKLKSGDFSDTLFQSTVKNLYKEHQLKMESNFGIAYALADAFSSNIAFQEVLEYPDRIRGVTKKEVMQIANEYFGENFIAFHSKMGVKKGPKIEKPGFEPLTENTEAQSTFAVKLASMTTPAPRTNFVDFEKDIKTSEVAEGYPLYWVKNPVNDIFTLKVRFGVGNHEMPMLKYASMMMNYAGTDQQSVSKFKTHMSMLGCDYTIYSDDNYLTFSLQGPEVSLQKAVNLLYELWSNPKLSESKMSLLLEGERANRKIEQKEPDMIAAALLEYTLYGEKSEYLDRLTIKELKALTPDTLEAVFKKALQYSAEFHYVGRNGIDEALHSFRSNFPFAFMPLPSNSPVYKPTHVYNDNKVFYVKKRGARQSKIFFYTLGETYTPNALPGMTAFNTYFGGGFTGLVLQEIREFRSMAYAAGASFSEPAVTGKPSVFLGYIGTQADKTNEAIEVFMDLLRVMPEKTQRGELIGEYIRNSALTQRPSFRNLSVSVVNWEKKGYPIDPAAIKYNFPQDETWEAINDFYKTNLQRKPVVIVFAGNKRKIDTKALKVYGEVEKIKRKKLYSK